jgi:hypothetical protein
MAPLKRTRQTDDAAPTTEDPNRPEREPGPAEPSPRREPAPSAPDGDAPDLADLQPGDGPGQTPGE